MSGRMTKVPLIYCGRRERDGKLCFLFIDTAGKEYSFKQLRGVFVGYSYYAQKNKDEMEIQRSPQEVDGQEEQHPKAEEWRAKQTVAIERHRKRLLRGAIDRNKFLLDEIGTIKKFVRGLSHGEIRDFIDWLVDEIYREQRAKELSEMNARLNRAVKRMARRQK